MSGTSPLRPPSGTRSRVGRVLVVDDDPQALAAMVAAVAGDYEIVTEKDPADAVARMEAGARFDVVLYDLTMKGMNGAELFARVCAISTRQAARIVFLGGGTMPLGLAEFLSRVSNPCLQRPMDLQALRALVVRRVAEERAREGPGSEKTG
jgi:CheY-like chemotaxis protein